SPADDAIFLEPVTDDSKPYFNLIAAREADKDKEVLKRIVKEYQSQEIGDLMIKVYKGAQFPVWEGYKKQ
ncbi:MAG: MetQ/NlpA family ABC transporter substrate-binding protein, partial [Clostridiaceae bacterium]